MKIDSIQLVRSNESTCWNLYVNDFYVGIYAPDSQAFTLGQTPLGILTECKVSITGSVYPKNVEVEFQEVFTDVKSKHQPTASGWYQIK